MQLRVIAKYEDEPERVVLGICGIPGRLSIPACYLERMISDPRATLEFESIGEVDGQEEIIQQLQEENADLQDVINKGLALAAALAKIADTTQVSRA